MSYKNELQYLLSMKQLSVDYKVSIITVFSSFNRLYKELFLSFQLIDTFPNHFLFYTTNYKDKEARTTYLKKLNKIFNNFILNPNNVIVIFNTSIKNNVIISILHIYHNQNIITKTIYHTINITSTEVELFSIRCGTIQIFL